MADIQIFLFEILFAANIQMHGWYPYIPPWNIIYGKYLDTWLICRYSSLKYSLWQISRYMADIQIFLFEILFAANIQMHGWYSDIPPWNIICGKYLDTRLICRYSSLKYCFWQISRYSSLKYCLRQISRYGWYPDIPPWNIICGKYSYTWVISKYFLFEIWFFSNIQILGWYPDIPLWNIVLLPFPLNLPQSRLRAELEPTALRPLIESEPRGKILNKYPSDKHQIESWDQICQISAPSPPHPTCCRENSHNQ